ncbi:ABC transporter permease subunit [candidate division KSB1 bacterium]|nr:ABC transporter permease subunit [candidate division KSB1 bacterium]
MLKTLIQKELVLFIKSPKFIVTFIVLFLLILLSVFLGIREYRANQKAYEAGIQLADKELDDATAWSHFSTRIFRKPNLMEVFIAGVNNDIGRWSSVMSTEPIKLVHSAYSDDPIFAVFRYLDISTIVMLILSLFAVLFTYDSINGEKQQGTLKLVFSNALPRSNYIVAKFLGSWIGLIVPLAIPALFGLLLVLVFKIPIDSSNWLRIILFLFLSIAYFTFFVALGILVSALTKRPSSSFLILLVVWVIFVFIVPRIGVMTASRIVPVQSVAEIDSQIDGYSKDQWNHFQENLTELWKKRNDQMSDLSREEMETFRDGHMWEWMQEEDSARKLVQTNIDDFSRKLYENFRNQQIRQEKLAFSFSRLSPASAYQLTAMNLAGTDIHLKIRYEQALEEYKKSLVSYAEEKQEESGQTGGIRISIDSASGMKIEAGRNTRLDVSDMPRFQEIKQTISHVLAPSIWDITLLIVYTLCAIAGSFAAFLRYDVR